MATESSLAVDGVEERSVSDYGIAEEVGAIIQKLDSKELCDFYSSQALADAAFPPSLVARLSIDQKQTLSAAIRDALLWTRDGRSYKKASAADGTARSICSASGLPTTIHGSTTKSSSLRVGCNRARFSVGPERVTFNLDHVVECKPLLGQHKERRLLKQSIPPDLENGAVTDLLPSLDAARIRDTDLKDRVRGFFARNLPSQDAPLPNSILRRIIDKAKNLANLSIPSSESMQQMLDNMKELKIPHSVDIGGDLIGGPVVKSIFMAIPELTRTESAAPFHVFTADATHKVVDPKSGFTKLSTISGLSPGHSIFPQVVSLITSESTETFIAELRFLIEIDPTIVNRETIFIVDGDEGRIKAIKTLLKKARVYLCLWHKKQNMIAKVGPAIRASQGVGLTKKALIETLHSLNLKGNNAEKREVLQARLDDHLSLSSAAPASTVLSSIPATLATSSSSNAAGLQPEEEEDPTSEEDGEDPDNFELPSQPDERDDASVQGVEQDLDADVCPDPQGPEWKNAAAVFKYLQRAWNETECDRRLDEAKTKFPTMTAYIDNELRRTKQYWADYSRVWGLTFGLSTSTMQENAQWSIKAHLRGRYVVPHRFVGFMKDVFARRQAGIEARLKSNSKLQTMLTSAGNMYSALVQNAQKVLSPEGLNVLLTEFSKADAYVIKELTDLTVVCDDIPLRRRGASAKRFSMLVTIGSEDSCDSRYFSVEHLDSKTVDIVCVLSDGSFACTCGRFATLGLPDRHCFALIRLRLAAFNPSVHVHPAYFKTLLHFDASLTTPGAEEQKAKNLIAITELTSWQTAVEATKERWMKEGMNVSSIVAISPNRVGSRAQTEFEMAKKGLHELGDIIQIDPKYRSRIIAIVAEIKAERQQNTVGRTVTTEGIRSQLPAPIRRTSSKRKTMAADHSAKGAKRGRPRKDTA